ncbi:MAG: type II secretion system protein GspM [Geminicoccales bacterium]
MPAPGSSIAKIAALAILLALVLAANQFVLQPLSASYRDDQAEIAKSRELLQRYRALAAERPGLIERLASLEADVESSAAYLEGGSDALAAAALQDRVADTIEIAGADIKSIRSLPAVDVEHRPDLQKTGLQLLFAGDIDSLAEALYELEAMDLLLSVSRLEVRAAAEGRAKNPVQVTPKLDVRIDVHGFARRRE